MKADIKWLDDPEVFRVNQLPAHSDHRFFANEQEYKSGQSSFSQSLNGTWKFKYSENAKSRPAEFYKEEYDRSGFDEIQVPGHIELAGYDKIHYINTMYPWEGHRYRRPAGVPDDQHMGAGMFSEDDYNPAGSYVTRFDLDEGLIGKRTVICFEGVEQAMYVWLNGSFVGYAEDSFTPSEFDLTPYIREKDNLLAVEVHKRSTAAFLEDQDFFRFFGIFRNVTLFAKPELHLEDMWAKPELDPDTGAGYFSMDMKISGDGASMKEGAGSKVHIVLKDREGCVCLEKEMEVQPEVKLGQTELKGVKAWDNKEPYLYTLGITLYNEKGEVTEFIPYQVGFRKVELKNKVICLNGKRLVINGVNRHEWSAGGGRCIGADEMKWDMECIRRNHINAVRTCHYPDQIPWYYMCDEAGVYVMAEVNLESHGSWQKMGAVEPSWNVPGDSEKWTGAVMDRAKSNFELLKNHTSILFWSLGNESYAGEAIARMNKYYKQRDNGRLVHYEGVFHNRKYEGRISDMESRMYASPRQAEEYLAQDPEKPFILCEYMHDMGNSLGGLKSYIDLIDKYEMYQGGFIWDFIDQALWVEDEVTGRRVLRYGGDFDDRPSDYEFSGNGIVFADRTEKPAMQEVRYYYGLYK
ncbi:glycoside hydrolase family 2 TIM barrel-domain containing protein [Murimonas intestini]|uniref:beta-galactosidase n=1 Tax=Murimonas intestini TaxID=1337051 RepID=A0AB73T5F4_9FIRM|nr:glycoside hydrolase family 2 TIM barrel-domain containing protein [Murimonas intestini]MCR1842091.1 beta-galactosidase [Murimonas intestini]MCR1864829.1 beta-galactosidase [Murimonas intestini]MCR1884156.1 beta-galactosidase [Murimonas intestini]